MNKISKRTPLETHQKLVDAAVRLILRQGFPATSVEQICAEAGVTKGSFFHHFPGKDAIGQAAADWWGGFGTEIYSAAWKGGGDPLEQLHRFFDIMIGLAEGRGEPCTCVVGILAQEMALSHSEFRETCARHLGDWSNHAIRLLEAARAKYPPVIDFDTTQVAWFLNSLWQGSMLIGKTRQSPEMIASNLRLARQWIDSCFGIAQENNKQTTI